MDRLRSFTRRYLPAREISDVNFFTDRCEPQHRYDLRIERSNECKRFAEHDLIRRLADRDFVKHLIRRRIEDIHDALFGVEHEAIAPAWSKTYRARAGLGLQLRQHLLALLVDHRDAAVFLACHVDRLAQFRQGHGGWAWTNFYITDFLEFLNVDD